MSGRSLATALGVFLRWEGGIATLSINRGGQGWITESRILPPCSFVRICWSVAKSSNVFDRAKCMKGRRRGIADVCLTKGKSSPVSLKRQRPQDGAGQRDRMHFVGLWRKVGTSTTGFMGLTPWLSAVFRQVRESVAAKVGTSVEASENFIEKWHYSLLPGIACGRVRDTGLIAGKINPNRERDDGQKGGNCQRMEKYHVSALGGSVEMGLVRGRNFLHSSSASISPTELLLVAERCRTTGRQSR